MEEGLHNAKNVMATLVKALQNWKRGNKTTASRWRIGTEAQRINSRGCQMSELSLIFPPSRMDLLLLWTDYNFELLQKQKGRCKIWKNLGAEIMMPRNREPQIAQSVAVFSRLRKGQAAAFRTEQGSG